VEAANHTGVIQAAGGLIWRDSPQGREVAIIHRARYGDWTLPKGKLKPGERWQDAALREVGEETGCKVRLGSLAGSVSYTVGDVPKVVLFWNMDLAGDCEFRPSEEVKQLVWLPASRAIEKLDYAGEKTLLRDSAQAPRRPSLWSRFSKRWLSASHARLANALAVYRVNLDYLVEQAAKQKEANLSWADAALTLLGRAEQALESRDVELGWRCFNASQRMRLFGLAALKLDDLQVEAQAVLREGSAKLASWRKQAVEDLLSKDGQLIPNVDVTRVFYASQILHEYNDNLYQKLRGIRQQLTVLACIALLAVVAWAILAPPLLGSAARIDDPKLVISTVLFGVMGASISGILSLAKGSSEARIPDQLVNSWINLARIAVGAVAALAAYTFLISGLLQIGTVTAGLVLAVAFASGFSERLVLRAVETVAR